MQYSGFFVVHAHGQFQMRLYRVTVQIETGVVSGAFPRRALAHVLEWYELRKSELRENWELAQNRKPLKKIQPLE
ncbi:MAG: DUF4160 domain-containing protein [Terriglobia bacterium]